MNYTLLKNISFGKGFYEKLPAQIRTNAKKTARGQKEEEVGELPRATPQAAKVY
jgi:hypothetical protein